MAEQEGVTTCEQPVWDSFGLTYAAYFCVPRLVLQAMPVEWQRQFVALAEKLPVTPTYDCRIRNSRGHFVKDDLRDYRHGSIPHEMAAEIERNIAGPVDGR